MIRYLAAIAACAVLFVVPPVEASSSSATQASRSATALININTADVATLAREMKGIGESKAQAIVEHRQKNGAFRSVDELALVKGIGAKTLENNRSRLTVGSGGATSKTPPA
ncbi:MAG: ComEA family DNA-binding protein [Gammaproteobacteria bacterium]